MPRCHLDRIEVEGYKSIAACDLPLRPLNVLDGPNGAGKSNFISAFGLLGAIVNGNLQLTVGRAGGASTILHGGPKRTPRLRLHTYFGQNQYEVELVPGANDQLIFERETCYFHGSPAYDRPYDEIIASGSTESGVRDKAAVIAIARYCLEAMESWRVFHFHDTSPQAGSKQKPHVDDNAALRADGANVAPVLLRLREAYPDHYRRIVDSIRMVAPFSKTSASDRTVSTAIGSSSSGDRSGPTSISMRTRCLTARFGSSVSAPCSCSPTHRRLW